MTLAPRVSDKLEIIAQMCDYVVGIDTHAKKHVYAVVSSNGGLLETRSYDADNTGIIKAIKWVANKYGQNVKFAVEGTSSYGEILCVLLQKSGYEVFEAKPPAKKTRVNNGKTDEIDALAAARSILDMKVIQLIKPRSQGNRKALRTLFDYRRFLTGKLTAAKNSLTAQVRGIDIGIDARNTLKTSQYKQIAGFRENRSDNFEQGIARQIAKSMAKEILDTIQKLKENEEQMKQIITELCPEILEFKGCGPVSAAIIICAYSHKGRIKSREAFAKLAGCAPIPASSGNTDYMRLSRGGDRLLNHAIYTIAVSRMRTDEETILYSEKDSNKHKSKKAIRRKVKTNIARRIFSILERANIGVNSEINPDLKLEA